MTSLIPALVLSAVFQMGVPCTFAQPQDLPCGNAPRTRCEAQIGEALGKCVGVYYRQKAEIEALRAKLAIRDETPEPAPLTFLSIDADTWLVIGVGAAALAAGMAAGYGIANAVD